MKWQGELVKIAVFLPAEAETPSALETWKALGGREPDTFQKPKGPMPGIAIASGKWNDFTLSVLSQPARVDVSLQRFDEEAALPTPPPLIPDVSGAIEVVQKLGEMLLKKQSIVRLGCALQLVRQIEQGSSAVAALNEEIGESLFTENTRDPLLQMNVRVSHGASGTEVNRLCRWGIAELQTMLFTVQPNAVQKQDSEQLRVVFMHIDVNNVALSSPLGPAQGRELLAFLWGQATRIMENGRTELA